MVDELKKLLNNAYAPYSKYRVAAIVVMNDSKKFSGVNVENASYGATICAERSAMLNAISNGYKKGQFNELHVMVDNEKIGYPCFVCRQVISELCNNNMTITLYNNSGEKIDVEYDDIIVHPFLEDNLK
jgi:cytidine deaminase